MTEQVLDNLIRRVILDVDNQEYGDLMDDFPEHDFLSGFEKKMQKLIRRANHPIWYRVTQAVACLLLAALLSGCTVLAVSPEARAALAGWVREVSEGWFVYHYTGETQDAPTDIVYCPTWVPDGYALVRESNHAFIYEDDTEGLLSFVYSDLDTSAAYLERKGVNVYSVFVGSYPADLYLDQQEGNTNNLIWVAEDKGLFFSISAPLTGEELIKIAESVEAVQ